MARSTVEIQADIDRLRNAIAQGALRVRFADRDVTYMSLRDLRNAMEMFAGELADADPSATRRARQIYFGTDKGLR